MTTHKKRRRKQRRMRVFFSSLIFTTILGLGVYYYLSEDKEEEKQNIDLTRLTSEELEDFVNDSILPSLALIGVYDKEGNFSRGGGFFISKNEIITCRHVVRGASSKAEVTMPTNPKLYPINLIAGMHPFGKDIMKVSLDSSQKIGIPLKVNYTLPSIGDSVWVIGFNDSSNIKIVSRIIGGKVCTIKGCKTKIDFTISADAIHGDSGCPVINKKGEVIGIVVSKPEESNIEVLATKSIKELKPLKEKYLSKWASSDGIKKEKYFSKGAYYIGKGKFEEAIYYFEKAIQIDSLNSYLYFLVGKYNFLLREYLNALIAFEKAIQIEPNDYYCHYGLGLTYLALGDEESAMKESKILGSLDTTFVWNRKYRAQMDLLKKIARMTTWDSEF